MEESRKKTFNMLEVYKVQGTNNSTKNVSAFNVPVYTTKNEEQTVGPADDKKREYAGSGDQDARCQQGLLLRSSTSLLLEVISLLIL